MDADSCWLPWPLPQPVRIRPAREVGAFVLVEVGGDQERLVSHAHISRVSETSPKIAL